MVPAISLPASMLSEAQKRSSAYPVITVFFVGHLYRDRVKKLNSMGPMGLPNGMPVTSWLAWPSESWSHDR